MVNPSSLFLSERTAGSAGSVVVTSLEGSRPILTEIQALVSSSPFGIPKRGQSGWITTGSCSSLESLIRG